MQQNWLIQLLNVTPRYNVISGQIIAV